MEMSGKTLRGFFFPMWVRFGGSEPAQTRDTEELPLRSDLFSADQMEQHGKLLAGEHQLMSGVPRDRLLARFSPERKPPAVHACGRLGGNGLRPLGGQPARVGAL